MPRCQLGRGVSASLWAPKGRPKFRDDPHPQTTDLDRLEGRRLRGVRTKGDRNDWVRWPLDRLRGRVYLHDHVCVGATGGPAEALDDRLVASPESQHKPGGDLGRGFLDPFQGELGVEEDVHLGRQRRSLHCPTGLSPPSTRPAPEPVFHKRTFARFSAPPRATALQHCTLVARAVVRRS